MKLDALKEYTKNDNLEQYIKLVKTITDIMDNSFWFQDKIFNNICHRIIRVLHLQDPVEKYCEMLVWPLLLCDDEEILFSKELNKMIHGPWISAGYSLLQELPANVEAFHKFMAKVNIIKIGYPRNPLKLKNNQKWNTIISKNGYFSYEKIKSNN